MPYELIYTSAPQGLNHGRSGFSTVARSADMPERLAAIVEKFSNFDHGICDKKYSLNKLSYSNSFYYVLTRICDCGSDYTNRTNFLAHHLVFCSEEILNYPNPAQIFLLWNGWLDSWNQEPKFLEPKNLEIDFIEFDSCKTWQDVFGDAGKASIPRSMLNCSFFLECKESTLLLELFAESLFLNVDKKISWDFTFTTYLAQNESAKDYNWKGYIQNPPNEFFIDLKNKSCPNAPESRLAEFARSAVMTKSEQLSLHIGQPKKISSSNFRVVEVEKEKNYTPIILASVCASIAIFILIIFLFSSTNSNAQIEVTESKTMQLPNFAAPTNTALDVSMKKSIIDLIEKGNYQDALDKWNNLSAKKDINVNTLITANIIGSCNEIDAYIAIGKFSARENMAKQKELKKHLYFLDKNQDFPNQDALKKSIKHRLKTLENF